MFVGPILSILDEVVQKGKTRSTQDILHKFFFLVQENLQVTNLNLPLDSFLLQLVPFFQVLMGLVIQRSYLFKPFVDVTLELCDDYFQLLVAGLLVLRLLLRFLQ